MFSIKDKKEALCRIITRWGSATGTRDHVRAWREIEDAILALDNAAYDRAYKKVYEQRHEQCSAECYEELTAELNAARRDTTTMTLANDDKRQLLRRMRRERDEARQALTRECRAVEWALKEFDAARAELANARATIRKMAEGRVGTLTRALETLADRYHAQMCYSRRRCRQTRQTCPEPPQAVKDAERALAGESETRRFSGKISHVASWARVLSPKEVTDAFAEMTERPRPLFDDLRTLEREVVSLGSALASDIGDLDGRVAKLEKEDPELEAVLIGSREVRCTTLCGCARVAAQGTVMYRGANALPTAPLFATKECAQKALRPRAPSTPPYAAYTDAMRREEGDCRS